jgi:hypothetical protein
MKTATTKSLLLLLSLTTLAAACAEDEGASGDGVEVTLGVAGKDDSIAGSVVAIYADGYSWMEPEQYVQTSVSVVSRTGGRLALDGYGVEFDVSNYEQTQAGTSCDFDSDCAGYNQGYCDYAADWDGECVGLNTPTGRWTLSAISNHASVDMGFMLFDQSSFEADGTTISCGGQNVFTSIQFDFDNEQITIDGRETYFAADCGLDLQRDSAVTQTLAAFGVPVRDYAFWTFDGEYKHRFVFTAN